MSTKDIGSLDERYQSVSHDLELPDTIKLPDGREFSVPMLLSQSRKDSVTGHIKSFRRNPDKKKPVGRFNAKYTEEETAWLLKATIEEVGERYKVDRKRALAILRYVYGKIGKVYKIPSRKPDKRTNPDYPK